MQRVLFIRKYVFRLEHNLDLSARVFEIISQSKLVKNLFKFFFNTKQAIECLILAFLSKHLYKNEVFRKT